MKRFRKGLKIDYKDYRGSSPTTSTKIKKKKRLEGYLKRYTVAIFTESFIGL